MVKYKEQREKLSYWEVIDVNEAHAFYCETAADVARTLEAVRLVGHQAIVKEVKRK